MGLSAGLNACDNDEAINLGHSPPRSNSTHTEQKKRSFMVNDILTDRISSSNSSPECSVDLTSKSLEMDPYLQFDMTASSPGSQTAIHGEPLDARISNNPTNFDFSSAVNVSRISEHQSKRPRMTKSPSKSMLRNRSIELLRTALMTVYPVLFHRIIIITDRDRKLIFTD